MSYERRLLELGYTIDPLVFAPATLIRPVRTGSLVFTPGQISGWEAIECKGKVGADLTLEQGYEAARLCALNNLRAIKTVIGSLDNIVRFVKVFGMVNVAPDFTNTSGVINGCSEFLYQVFGEASHHARSAVGMTIPFNWAVEIEMVVEVR
jgi:enamine deaminase RidA (YjgF/YER057c/UK114 family)